MKFLCESCHEEYSTKEYNRTNSYEHMCNTCFDEYENSREYNLLIVLEENYDDVETFTDIVVDIEKEIIKGKFSEKWSNVYNDYCERNKPLTSDFSYLDLGDEFLEKIK